MVKTVRVEVRGERKRMGLGAGVNRKAIISMTLPV